MAVIMGGTPEFLMDPRRGLYSYEALQTRLAENQFAVDGLKDLSGPVIRLSALAQEELFVLLEKLRNIQAAGVVCDYVLPDEALPAFMNHCSETRRSKLLPDTAQHHQVVCALDGCS